MRTCKVKGRKATFHKWSHKAWPVEAGLTVGSHRGGQMELDVAIIEYEDGSVAECNPCEVTFTDTMEKGAKTMERRAAKVTFNEWLAQKYSIAAGTYTCYVLDLFQYTCGDEARPIFVVELKGGKLLEGPTEAVQFVDTTLKENQVMIDKNYGKFYTTCDGCGEELDPTDTFDAAKSQAETKRLGTDAQHVRRRFKL